MIPFYKTYEVEHTYLFQVLEYEYKISKASDRNNFYNFFMIMCPKYDITKLLHCENLSELSIEEFDKIIAIFKLQNL